MALTGHRIFASIKMFSSSQVRQMQRSSMIKVRIEDPEWSIGV